MIRQPIITVLGHVDHGKTSLLDAIRDTRVASKEEGAITQHIGATEVPIDAIHNVAGPLIKKFGFNLTIPGLLFIDTPGHEAFTNLRKRGGGIADLAILVIDINQGIQPQTIEAIEILRAYKVPFVIALTKIDSLNFYSSKKGNFIDNLSTHNERSKQLFDEKLYTIVGELYKYGFEGERYDRCVFGKQIPMVPCSAHTKEGLAELITLLAGLSQKYLEKKLEISFEECAKAAVLESKEEKGLGKTIDVLLYQGTLNVNDDIAVLGKNGVIQTKVRILLQPKPMQEIRSTKDKFSSVKSVSAACGVKIAAPKLEEVLAGSTLIQIRTGKEVDELHAELMEHNIEADINGLVFKADAIGSLEAMTNLLNKEGYTLRKAQIGNITRKDVMEAASLQAQDSLLGVVLGFNVQVDLDAQIEADKRGVKIFNEKVIYHLIENYKNWVEEKKRLEKQNEMNCLVMPVEFELIRGKVFRNNKPAIVGVRINVGKLREGWRVMNKEGEVIGKIEGIQSDGKSVEEAKLGEEVAVSIGGANIGRNLFEGDKLYSCIPIKHYAGLTKYLSELSEEEKELLQIIKNKQKTTEEEE
ncbi:MAG: translation initiation factor IF-2 [Candidatus Iainarchaeum sp.]|jgi:translation initiation factor 5B